VELDKMESQIKITKDKLITKDELRKLSIEFRTVSGRLIRTHPDEGMSNLKRFMNFIENSLIIKGFIQENNTNPYNIEFVLGNISSVEEYIIPDDSQEKEISFTYQLLKYGLEKYYQYSDGYQYLSYALFGYCGNTKEQVERFNFSVVKPLVNYIENHLTHLQIDMGDAEQARISIQQVYGDNYGDNLGIGGTRSEMNINQSNSSLGVGVNQGEINAEKLAGTINEEQKPNLAEAAAEIRQLLNQLEQSYPTNTLVEKATVADIAIQRIEANPTLKGRVIGLLKSASVEAFKEAVNHPLINILMAGIEGWQQGKD
jgi:hypothetical protein